MMPVIDIFMGLGLIVCAIVLPFINNMIPENVVDINSDDLYSNLTLTTNISCGYSALLYVSSNNLSVIQIEELNSIDAPINDFIEIRNITEDDLYILKGTPKWIRSDGQVLKQYMTADSIIDKLGCKVKS